MAATEKAKIHGEKVPPWRAQVLTLFPELFPGPLAASLTGKGLERGIWALESVNIRDFATDRHGSVDDQPFGGGPGMVMRPDIVSAALDHAVAKWPAIPGEMAGETVDRGAPILYLSPRGQRFDQAQAKALAQGPGVTLLCGRYEGIDERIIEARSIQEVSLGDFVLSGGEVAAMALLDAVVRLLPGILGAAGSLDEESFEDGLLEYPHYTRPEQWTDPNGTDRAVPEVLISGHHGRIAAWRRAAAEQATKERRPDLWDAYRAAQKECDGPRRATAKKTKNIKERER